MANINVRRSGGEMAPAVEWDPFRAMREIMRWDPFREMAPVFGPEPAGFNPAFDIKENRDGFVFRADLPGVQAEDLRVTVEGSRLQVSGKRETEREEKTDTYYASERSFGSFVRTFTLPQGADPRSVHADLSEGVLTISIARTAESQPRQVAVQSAATKPKS
jgi:HSP20 family protein